MTRTALGLLMTALLAACTVEPNEEEATGESVDPAITAITPINLVRTDAEIVSTTVASHLPHAVVNTHSAATQEVTLWAVGTVGLKERRWTLANHAWNNAWISRGNQTAFARTGDIGLTMDTVSPASWNTHLAMVPSFGDASNNARARGFFQFNANRSGMSRIGLPTLFGSPTFANATYSWRRLDALAGGFIPRTGFSWRQGALERINVFGTDAAKQNLVELHFDGASWHQSVHPKPNSFSGRMLVGTQSAMWDPVSGQGYVFVEVERNDGAASLNAVWCRYWNGSTWAWIDLGQPFHGYVNGYSDEGLIALGYRDGNGFVGTVALNARSIDGPNGQHADAIYTLLPFTDTPAGNQHSWRQWVRTNGDRYTSGVTYNDGTRRFALFGHNAAGQHIRMDLTGLTVAQNWSFASPVAAPEAGFKTDSSYLVQNGSDLRIGVVGRTSTGRVYEYVYANGGWSWANLSTYTLELQSVQPIGFP
jgi:hypothetical protein